MTVDDCRSAPAPKEVEIAPTDVGLIGIAELLKRPRSGLLAKIRKIAFWVLVLAQTARLLPEAIGDDGAPPA
jgi:hypothetical protein